jgi:hypothetical protein
MDPQTLRDTPTRDLIEKASQLERSIGALAQNAAEIEAQVSSLRAEISRQTQHLNTIKNEVERRNTPAPEPRVSDHALLRYMERVMGLPVEDIRNSILTPAVSAAIQAGASGVQLGGVKFVVKGCTIVTALGEDQRVKSKDKRRGKFVKLKPEPNLRDEVADYYAEESELLTD